MKYCQCGNEMEVTNVIEDNQAIVYEYECICGNYDCEVQDNGNY